MSDRKLIDAAYRNWRDSLDDPAFASPTSFDAGYRAALSAPIPREPTAKMFIAGNAAYKEQSGASGMTFGAYRAIWQGMLDAATQPAEQTTINDAGGESPVVDGAGLGAMHGTPAIDPIVRVTSAQPAVPTNEPGTYCRCPNCWTEHGCSRVTEMTKPYDHVFKATSVPDPRDAAYARGWQEAINEAVHVIRSTAVHAPSDARNACANAVAALNEPNHHGRVATTQGSREPESHILRSAHPDPRDAEIATLRNMLACAYSGPLLYRDDGELQDCRMVPFIDFKRDSVAEIDAKMLARANAVLAAKGNAPCAPGYLGDINGPGCDPDVP